MSEEATLSTSESVPSTASERVVARRRIGPTIGVGDQGPAAAVAIDAVPAAMLVADRQGRVEMANRAWTALTGLDPAASTGERWLACVAPEHRTLVRSAMRAASRGAGAATVDGKIGARDGSERWVRWTFRSTDDTVVALAVDVDDDLAARDRLAERAVRDPLTGLLNRSGLFETIEQTIGGRRNDECSAALLYIDLDGFKAVNDCCGHRAGDQLLAHVADALVRAVRPDDVVGRVGGDEFAVLCRHLEHPGEADAIASRVRTAVAKPVVVGGRTWHMTASVGVARASGGEGAVALLDRADQAMYVVKRQLRRPRGRASSARSGPPADAAT